MKKIFLLLRNSIPKLTKVEILVFILLLLFCFSGIQFEFSNTKQQKGSLGNFIYFSRESWYNFQANKGYILIEHDLIPQHVDVCFSIFKFEEDIRPINSPADIADINASVTGNKIGSKNYQQVYEQEFIRANSEQFRLIGLVIWSRGSDLGLFFHWIYFPIISFVLLFSIKLFRTIRNIFFYKM